MKPLRILPLLLAAALTTAVVRAQTVIDLAAYVDEQTTAQIGEANATALKNKISRIITRNGMADVEGLFAVVPTITITDDGNVDTGMTSLRVVRADFTLAIRNLVDNTTFASQTVALQANGKSDEACMRSLINKVNVNDVRFAKMIRDTQQAIADYYARMMPRILAKVDSHVAREEYADAMAVLAVVPECVEEYPRVAELKVQVYNKLLSNDVTCAIAEAEILVRQGDIDGALNLCRACNPLSPNYGEVIAFMRRLDAAAAAAEAEALEAELRKADAAKQQERMAEEADLRGDSLRAERTDSCKKKGKSLGEWLFGL